MEYSLGSSRCSNSIDDNSEHDIILKLKQGDQKNFMLIVDKYKSKIIRLCWSYTYDEHEAEDLSQEVFISFYKSIKDFREECSLSTFLYKISVSKCLSYKRKKNIKTFLSGLFYADKASSNEFNKIDDKNFVRECINGLPQDLKICIVLYYYSELTYKEISEILKISEKAVEGRIYRAKQKLRTELEKGGFCCAK